MKTAVVTQSNYLPWRGYFDLFRRADEVVLLDSVQYTRRDWRNRNIIKTPNGPAWISVPVEVKGRYYQTIDETRVAGAGWARQHCRAIEGAYRRAAAFDSEAPRLFDLLQRAAAEPMLSGINEMTLRALCARLGIDTPIRRCVDLLDRNELIAMKPTDRLIRLTLAAGARQYLSGPAAQAYLDEAAFAAADIKVVWMSYEGYPPYPQLGAPFDPRVSIVDLILNTGADAPMFVGPGPAAPVADASR